jgi:hypothetical protein
MAKKSHRQRAQHSEGESHRGVSTISGNVFASPYRRQGHMSIDLLDDSEFPSLSGASQQQQQVAAAAASSQAIWGSTGTVRGPPSTTTRSTNTPTSTTQAIRQPSQISTQARQPETQEESSPSPFPSLGSGLDDYPFGQSPASQMARQHQQQQSVTEEFPPLGGLGVGTIGHQQRSRLGQDPMTNTIDAIGTNQNQARAGQDVLPPGIIIEPKSSPTNPGSRGMIMSSAT